MIAPGAARDSDGRVMVTIGSGTTPTRFLNGVGIMDDGSLAIDTAAPSGSFYKSGFRISAAGAIYGTETAAGPDVYIGGVRVSVAGQLVVTPGSGAPTAYVNGNPVTSAGAFAVGTTEPITNGIILDTDLDSDVDDLHDLALFLDLADEEDLTPLAVTVCSSNDFAAPCARAMLDAYSYTGVPVGAWLVGGAGTPSSYCETTRDAFRPGDTRANYEAAYRVMRRALLRAEDGTAQIIVTGSSHNIAALIESTADDISPLTGAQLLALKCAAILPVMAFFDPRTIDGTNPQVDNSNAGMGGFEETNVVAGFTGCPVIWCGLENADDITDPDNIVLDTLRSRVWPGADPTVDPIKFAWDETDLGKDADGYRMAVSSSAIRYAALGAGSDWTLSSPGDVTFSGVAPYTHWTPNGSSNHTYLVKAGDDDVMTADNEYRCFRVALKHSAQYIANSYMGQCRFEYQLLDGASATTQVITDTSPYANHGQRGTDGSATSTDPAWHADGLDFDGSNDSASAPGASGTTSDGAMIVAAVRADTLSGVDQIITRGTSNTRFQVRFNGGTLQYVRIGALGTDTVSDGGGASSTATWYMVVIKQDNFQVVIRKNAAEVADSTITNLFPSGSDAYLIGNRAAVSEYFDGRMAYIAFFRRTLDEDIAAIEARVIAAIGTKGITLS